MSKLDASRRAAAWRQLALFSHVPARLQDRSPAMIRGGGGFRVLCRDAGCGRGRLSQFFFRANFHQHFGTNTGRSSLRQGVTAYRDISKTRPFTVGFVVCFAKGVLADSIAQITVEGTDSIDSRRLLAMAFFSGTFTGCGYHVIFNIVFARFVGDAAATFGTSCTRGVLAKQVFAKIALDALVVFPFLYMPWFLLCDEGIRLGSLAGVCGRWRAEVAGSLHEYTKIWPAAVLCVFTVVPVELRVSFISAVSLCWLVVLSMVTNASCCAQQRCETLASTKCGNDVLPSLSFSTPGLR